MRNLQQTENIDTIENSKKTALITGANSGIGFETAAILTEEGFGKVILAVRTIEKGEAAKVLLIERTGKDVFEILVIDVAEFDVVHAAADELKKRKNRINFLILNAGMSPGNTDSFNTTGVEMTFASNIIGHHVLTMRLLADGLLSSNVRIVIAGSEGSRGDMMGMSPPDFDELAKEHFEGNLETTLQAIARYQKPYEDKVMNLYVTAKTFSNWWAAVLSRKLPAGMIVNSISPGSVPSTNFARHQGFMMRRVMVPMLKYMGRFMSMAWKLEDGANRYIEGGKFSDENTGHFYASPAGKLTGKMEIQTNEHFLNKNYQKAGWNTIVTVSGGIDYPKAITA